MKISTFQKRMLGYYKSGDCIMLRGPIGRGKSTVIEGAAAMLSKELGGNYGVVIVSGPLLNPPDAVGYLMPNKVGDKMESKFTEPFWFRTAEGKHISEFDGGIIFVDEADKMDTDVKKVIGEAALSRRLGPHVLPKGWRVWMAGNRADDKSGSTKEYYHLINRRQEITLDDDINDLEKYMWQQNCHPVYITFAASNPEVVFEPIPEQQRPFCTPRALVKLAEYHRLIADNDESLPFDSDFMEEAAGRIGPAAAAQLLATLKLGAEMPKFQDIIAHPKQAKVPKAPDAQILVVYSLAARVDETTMGPVIDYIERFPPEFSITFGKSACRRDESLIETAAFGKWVTKNGALMMAITDTR
jgi:hypothetical protein